MLIAKGYNVEFRNAETGRLIRPAGAFLHDPSGQDWPRCSVLIGSFRRGRKDRLDYRPAVEYFNYEPRGGGFKPPPKSLNTWTFVAEVDRIKSYIRPGDKEFEGRFDLLYEHDFKKVGAGLFMAGKHFPLLFRRGRVHRLELGTGCVVNWRGFVTP